MIESNVVASDLSVEKVEESLAGKNVGHPVENVGHPDKKLDRHKEVTC